MKEGRTGRHESTHEHLFCGVDTYKEGCLQIVLFHSIRVLYRRLFWATHLLYNELVHLWSYTHPVICIATLKKACFECSLYLVPFLFPLEHEHTTDLLIVLTRWCQFCFEGGCLDFVEAKLIRRLLMHSKVPVSGLASIIYPPTHY